MCILFFFVNSAPLAGHYKLVLINNRDESYFRPTKECHFWENHSNIIGGMDMLAGKEGGTWLAMNKQGKLGAILNILRPQDFIKSDKLGRGFLVPDFLSSTLTGDQYLHELSKKSSNYSLFNLVTIELNAPDIHIGHYTNLSSTGPSHLSPGEYGFGNSSPETPWKKVTYGKNKFSKIIAEHPTICTSEDLIHNLLDLLSDEHSLFPDLQLQSQTTGYPVEYVKKLHSLNVTESGINYGTRTNTIILVDANDQVTFVEKTMKTPIDIQNPKWSTSKFNFKLAN